MPHSEYGDLWREYMNRFAECLLEMHGDEASPAGKRLVRSLPLCTARREASRTGRAVCGSPQ